MPLTGNVAKVHVLAVMEKLFTSHYPLDVCDVGCVGLRPFDLWEPLFQIHSSRFHLSGLDLFGIERAAEVARERGWSADLRTGDARAVEETFPDKRFDVVVSTQVLEHVRAWDRSLESASRVLKPGGHILVTCDSGEARATLSRRLRHSARRRLGTIPSMEHRWERAPRAEEIVNVARRLRLPIAEWGYYNLAPLKHIHNRADRARRNGIMKRWYALERCLNSTGEARANPHQFLGLFFDFVSGEESYARQS